MNPQLAAFCTCRFLQKYWYWTFSSRIYIPAPTRVKCFPGSVRENRMATVIPPNVSFLSLSLLTESISPLYPFPLLFRSVPNYQKNLSMWSLFASVNVCYTSPQIWLLPICTLICLNCNFSPILRASDILNPIFQLSHTLTLFLLPSVRPITFSFRS